MHICVSKLTIICSDNGLSPGRCQAIIWTSAGMLLIGPVGTKFNDISIEIFTFSFKKMHLKMSTGKWRPFCLGLHVLTLYDLNCFEEMNVYVCLHFLSISDTEMWNGQVLDIFAKGSQGFIDGLLEYSAHRINAYHHIFSTSKSLYIRKIPVVEKNFNLMLLGLFIYVVVNGVIQQQAII